MVQFAPTGRLVVLIQAIAIPIAVSSAGILTGVLLRAMGMGAFLFWVTSLVGVPLLVGWILRQYAFVASLLFNALVQGTLLYLQMRWVVDQGGGIGDSLSKRWDMWVAMGLIGIGCAFLSLVTRWLKRRADPPL